MKFSEFYMENKIEEFDVIYNKKNFKCDLKGGMADGKVPSDFDYQQLKKGAKVEFEHTNDIKIAMKIAMDHLMEDENYYIKLEKVEKH